MIPTVRPRFRTAQVRHQTISDLPGFLTTDCEDHIDETHSDQSQERDDRQLEAAVAALLEGQDHERNHRGDQPRGEQRYAEDEVEADGGAYELRQVSRHRDDLGLQPQNHVRAAAESLAAQLRQAAAGRQSSLGGEVLDQDGHQVGHHDHPYQFVAVPRAGGEVRCEITRVDVSD